MTQWEIDGGALAEKGQTTVLDNWTHLESVQGDFLEIHVSQQHTLAMDLKLGLNNEKQCLVLLVAWSHQDTSKGRLKAV